MTNQDTAPPQEFPLITIGMCCYNSEDTVARAIDSALAQDWPNFELLIVDDGSKDKTPDIIKAKIEGHPNARFIQHEVNKTFPGALNTVLSESKGEFIAIFDDDDESRPNRLSIQYKTITDYETETGAKLVACWGSGVRRYPNGYEVRFQAIGSEEIVPKGTMIADRILYYEQEEGVFYGSGTPSCSLMTRKSTYDIAGPYDETMFRSEDADFAIRFGMKGGHYIGCKEEVIIQYSTGGNEKNAQNMYNSYRLVMEKYKDYLIKKKRFNYAMTWNKLRLHHFSKNIPKACLTLAYLFLRHPVLTWGHFWDTAPKRLIHEWKMARKPKNGTPQ